MAWNNLHTSSSSFSCTDADEEKEHVEHDYHDHSKDRDLPDFFPGISHHLFPFISGGKGTDQTFPMKLHTMLENIEKDGLASIVSWQPHGRCFVVHKQDEFVAHILPRYVFQCRNYFSWKSPCSVLRNPGRTFVCCANLLVGI